jgi:AcrR family transcriptional regulator
MATAEKDAPVTEQRILDAATDLFFERGYHATTMRDIASAVGIKAGSLYNHYAGKQEILLRISLETSRELYEGALSALEGVADVEDQLRAFIVYHVTFHTEVRKPCRVSDTQLHYLERKNRATVVEVRDAHEKLLRDILDRGIKQRRWRSENVHVVAIAITTMCTEVDAWYHPDGPLKPNEIATIYADFVRRGLGTP